MKKLFSILIVLSMLVGMLSSVPVFACGDTYVPPDPNVTPGPTVTYDPNATPGPSMAPTPFITPSPCGTKPPPADTNGYIIVNGVLLGYSGTATDLTIPDNVTSIGDSALSYKTGITSVAISNNVISIGSDSFEGCYGLKSVTIANSVTNIGNGAFSGCGLTSVTIPDSVSYISENAFSDCGGLTQILVDSNNPYYSSQDGVLFGKYKTYLLQYPSGKTGAYVIPSSVASIANDAFSGCQRLTSVDIPSSVTSIGEAAFYECQGLTSISIPNKLKNISNYTFNACKGLISVTIPSSVTSISNEAFIGCSKLNAAIFYGNSPSMGSRVFSFCGPAFKVYYINGKTGFTNPWYGYQTTTETYIPPTPTPTASPPPTPTPPPSPLTPTNLTISILNNIAHLLWTPSTSDFGIAGYNIYRDGIKINTEFVIVNNYNDPNVENDITYCYKIEAIDSSGNTAVSDENVFSLNNPIQNFSFENTTNGIQDNWAKVKCWDNPDISFSYSNTVKHTGGRSAQISANNINDLRYSQAVPVKKNTKYRLSGYIKTLNVQLAQNQQVGANFTVLYGSNSIHTIQLLSGTNNSTWNYVYTDVFDSGNNVTVTVQARLGYESNTCTGTAWFDDMILEEVVTVTPTPPPVTATPPPVTANPPPVTQTPPLSTQTPPPTPPLAPTGLTSPSKTITTVNLSWTPVAGATGYNVYIAGTTLLTTTPVTSTTYTVTGLTEFTVNSFTIKSVNAQGESQASTALNVTTILLGDATGDNRILASDALKILQFVSGKAVLTDEQKIAADVTKNGLVQAADALMIIQYKSGKITKF